MRVLICGGRDYDDRDHIWNTLTLFDIENHIDCVIHGCATGADTQGMIWAQALQRKHAPFEADWHRYGKAAGPRRNQRMIDEGKPDIVIAFPGGRGTADMVRRAKNQGIPVISVVALALKQDSYPKFSDNDGGEGKKRRRGEGEWIHPSDERAPGKRQEREREIDRRRGDP